MARLNEDRMPQPRKLTEWDMAIIAASFFWPGTSLTDGALWVLAQVNDHGEQVMREEGQ